ncbi:hypothetical protein GEV33_004920 [Tenebrio molitor]|uniref:Uncharacterized protein n=1 Tax=Tenebrio molitor TaxID=7067 RepID=A0A8J6HPV0_TENMO|nr:hypothetical protein GEV33_004920 [Tenebrio molitor]
MYQLNNNNRALFHDSHHAISEKLLSGKIAWRERVPTSNHYNHSHANLPPLTTYHYTPESGERSRKKSTRTIATDSRIDVASRDFDPTNYGSAIEPSIIKKQRRCRDENRRTSGSLAIISLGLNASRRPGTGKIATDRHRPKQKRIAGTRRAPVSTDARRDRPARARSRRPRPTQREHRRPSGARPPPPALYLV